MQRIVHRQVTTIQITSIEVLWDDEKHPDSPEVVDATTVPPALPAPKTSRQRKKNSARKPKKAGTRGKKSAPVKGTQGEVVHPSKIVHKNQE